VPLANSKRCFTCKGLFACAEFTKDKSKPDGLNIYCKLCSRRHSKEYKRKTKEKQKEYRKKYNTKESGVAKNREYFLKTRYGITIEQFETFFDLQDRKCALCRSETSDGKNFVVDHCHKTGKIRGILCSFCNRALGMFKDDTEILKKAIEYLEK